MIAPADADPMVPMVARVLRSRRELSDVWTLDIDAGVRRPRLRSRSVQHALRLRRRRGRRSRSAATRRGRKRLVHTIRARRQGLRRPRPPRTGRHGSACAARSAAAGRSMRRRSRRRHRRRRARSGPAAAVDLPVAGGPRALRPDCDALRRAQARRYPFPQRTRAWRARFDIEVEVTVDHADQRLARPCRGGDDAHRTGGLRAIRERVAMVCGPEVMMRFAVIELAKAGVAPASDLSVDGAQHEMRHRTLRPLPVRLRLRLQGRPGLATYGEARPLARDAGDLTWRAETEARRLEVRLVRRLPAFAARLRGRTARGRRRGRDRLLPRGHARRRRGAL